MSGELKGFDAGLYLSQKEMARLDPFVQYAVAASFMAAEDAGLVQKSLASGGVIIGSSRGGISTIEDSLIGSSRLRLSPYLMPSTGVNAAASYVAQKARD